VVASNPAGLVGMWVIHDAVVVPDVAIAPYRPSPRPRAYVPVGGHLLQHSTTPTSGCDALPAEHDHTDTVFTQFFIGIEEDGVQAIHSQETTDQQPLKGEHPYYPRQQHLHDPTLLSLPTGSQRRSPARKCLRVPLPEVAALLERPEPIGPGLWGKANFAMTAFSVVRLP
jgi:hypothetical protein